MLATKPKSTRPEEKYEPWILYPEQVPAMWPEMEPLVVKALEQSHGELTAADVLKFLCEGYFAAFIAARDDAIELLMIAEIVRFPRLVKANIIILAGKGVWKAEKFLPVVEAWATSHGAVELTGYVPPEPKHSRLYRRSGFHVAYHVVTKDLRRKLQ